MLKNSSGLTLIETIISIAIIGIIAIGILSVLSSGFAFIMRAGDISDATFRSKSQIETTVNSFNTDPSPTNLSIVFSSDNSTISAKGQVETITQNVGNIEVDITFFQPKY